MATENKAWNLEDFVDSLVVELDKTRETLAIKAINKPLTYTVKDLAMDVNIFPTYDGDQIRFTTAQPGQQEHQSYHTTGPITDQQVRATSKVTALKNDVTINDMDVDKDTKKQLRKIGVTSVDDLKQIERKDVDIKKVSSENNIDYSKLANQIQKSKRNDTPPKVVSASLSIDENKQPYLYLRGHNLAVNPKFKPVAVVNKTLAEVVSQNENEIKIQLTKAHNISSSNQLVLTIDPFAVVKLNVKL